MPLLIPTTKQGLKDAIFEALVRQSKVTSGDPVVSYNQLSIDVSMSVDQYVATELYKIKIALQLPSAYTAPTNNPPSSGGPLVPSAIITSFASVPENVSSQEEQKSEFQTWKEGQIFMSLLNKTGLQNEIFRAFNERTTEPATGDPELAYRKIAETIGEGIAGYVTNEMSKLKFALIQPAAFTAAGAAVSAGSISAYEPGIPSGPFI